MGRRVKVLTWWREFDTQVPHDGGREPSPGGYPLTNIVISPPLQLDVMQTFKSEAR